MYIELSQPAPYAQVRYLTHSIQLSGHDIARILTRLSKQTAYEVYSGELFQRIDSDTDQAINREELLSHWEPLNWSKEEKKLLVAKIDPS